MKWKLFSELTNEKITIFNEEMGEKEWQLPLEKKEFGNFNGKFYLIVFERRSELRISEKYKIYVRSKISNLSFEYRINTLFLISECSDKSFDIIACCDSKSFGGTLNNKIPKCFDEIKGLCKKSESLDTKTLPSFCANLKTCPLETVFGGNFTSCFSFVKNENKPLCTFSSNKNLILHRKQILSSDFCGEFQGSIDMLLGQGRVSFNDFSDRSSSLQHLQNKINHNSSSLKSGFSMTNLTVNDNVLINFNSHKNINEQEVYKDFELMLIKNSSSMLNNGTGLCIGGC